MAAVLKSLSGCLMSNLATSVKAPIPLVAPQLSRVLEPVRPATTSPILYQGNSSRCYAKKSETHFCEGCLRALKDIPKPVDPDCPLTCKRKKINRKGILYKLRLKIVEGGTNFGTPFRHLKCKLSGKKEKPKEEVEPVKLPMPKMVPASIEQRPGCQVSILGADTAVGQYTSLLLKQCPQVKKLRLYQAGPLDCSGGPCPKELANKSRDMFKIAQDLQHIDTNCLVQAFSCCSKQDLELCLQNSDIVLILESAYANVNMPFEKRFECQAPVVRRYADAIAQECPKAMVIVCATPVDCMVPLVAETLKETGWFDKNKLIGSMAVPEMRASTLAARALSLEPLCTRVPCVGGTEGQALVPLFSKTVSYFDFDRHHAEMLTSTVRCAPWCSASDPCCAKSASLSEAHALARLVKNVAHARLCHDITKVSGFVETDASQIISPARYLGLELLLNSHGICHKFDIPPLNKYEVSLMDESWKHIKYSVDMATAWCRKRYSQESLLKGDRSQHTFYHDRKYNRIEDCVASALT